MDRVQTKRSSQKEFHKKTLLNTLKAAYQKHSTPNLYLEERALHIVTSFLGESEIFSAGFTNILNRNRVPEEGINRVIIVALMG